MTRKQRETIAWIEGIIEGLSCNAEGTMLYALNKVKDKLMEVLAEDEDDEDDDQRKRKFDLSQFYTKEFVKQCLLGRA